ncbi:tRNA lysidine(34) synthetase TilS [Oceanirhabdus sp. W0125-5]|uniref:tRNA lysidine(34) synthetase TilS n=1 Tax=Oceanirhabdus sp. W0125-5 TaxID=2999116 RepID=UPI0022F34818|nr:tRNA lysidine(34) synthetase TilS [Oceanirhabdus sp. W0125-5]WBW97942.1 tRNA lysidine(34) synthetase TilS [Oceanirhabdus sp. W0125-5]
MINKVESYIKYNNMIDVGDTLIVGVSGGPDSMCLLNILLSLKEKYKLRIVVAHINHGLRGKESDDDEKYVEKYCEGNGMIFRAININVDEIAKSRKISSEMAGRDIRYEFFNKLKDEYKGNKIALAHNANDVAETIMMRIVRGTGIDGLEGIKAVREGVYIRPILCLKREEIENYCDTYNLNPRIDKTNLENIYSRNKIRLDVLPYLKENFNEDIINTLLRLSKNVARDNDYFRGVVHNLIKDYCEVQLGEVILNKELFEVHDALLTRCIRECIAVIKGNTNNLEQVHIYDIIKLSKKESGKKIDIPGGLLAMNSFGNIIILKKDTKLTEKLNLKLEISEKNTLPNGDIIEMCIRKRVEIKSFSKSKCTKYFDYDKIKGNIYVRNKREGDTMIPLGMKGRKKLKKIFSENKIPPHMRNTLPIITFDNEIAWIIGYTLGEKYKIDNRTENVLIIEYKGEKKYE